MFFNHASMGLLMLLRHGGALLLVIAGLLNIPAVRAEPLAEIRLQIGMHIIQAEVAATPESRSHGLMQRTRLGKNHGMLFVFESRARQAMWMRNTPLPLAVAFIDHRGVILNIEEMKPLSDTAHSSIAPAKYALEMNGGWFSKHGVKAGDKVQGLPP